MHMWRSQDDPEGGSSLPLHIGQPGLRCWGAVPFPTKSDSPLILKSAIDLLLTVTAGGLFFICKMKLQLLLRHLTDEHFQQAANNKQSIVSLPNEDVAGKERPEAPTIQYLIISNVGLFLVCVFS